METSILRVQLAMAEALQHYAFLRDDVPDFLYLKSQIELLEKAIRKNEPSPFTCVGHGLAMKELNQ